jgi:fungal STAND N-terminal Goodbye domain
MSTHSESFVLQLLLEGAFTEYEKRAGRNLVGHPLLNRLKQCNSVESVTAVLEEQAQAFREFRGDDGKMMKSLKHAVHFLYALSTSAALSQGLPFVVRSA